MAYKDFQPYFDPQVLRWISVCLPNTKLNILHLVFLSPISWLYTYLMFSILTYTLFWFSSQLLHRIGRLCSNDNGDQ